MAATTPRRSTRATGNGRQHSGPFPTYRHLPSTRKWNSPAPLGLATLLDSPGCRSRYLPDLCNPNRPGIIYLHPDARLSFSFTSTYTSISSVCKWLGSDISATKNDPIPSPHLHPLTTAQNVIYCAVLPPQAGVLTAQATLFTAQKRLICLKTGVSAGHLQHLHPFTVIYTSCAHFTCTLTPSLKGVSVSEGIIWMCTA